MLQLPTRIIYQGGNTTRQHWPAVRLSYPNLLMALLSKTSDLKGEEGKTDEICVYTKRQALFWCFGTEHVPHPVPSNLSSERSPTEDTKPGAADTILS